MNQSMREINLIEEITMAFKGVSREGGVSLRESWVMEDYGSLEKRLEARNSEIETNWQDVPSDEIGKGYFCLHWMDPIGFRYYIPAYMIWYIRNYRNDSLGRQESTLDHVESILIDAVISRNKNVFPMFRIFNHEQCKSIAHFVEFIAIIRYEMDRKNLHDEYSCEDSVVRSETFDEWSCITGDSAVLALERYWNRYLA